MIVEKSAGGIVYKKQNGQVMWLVRLPVANPEYRGVIGWTLPKGYIEVGESVETAALREVLEETGVKARIIRKIPTIKYFFSKSDGEKILKFVTFFVMEYESSNPEGYDGETQEVRWVTLDEATKLLAYKNEKKLLQDSVGVLK